MSFGKQAVIPPGGAQNSRQGWGGGAVKSQTLHTPVNKQLTHPLNLKVPVDVAPSSGNPVRPYQFS